mmetsp:Transcript_71811/g.126817  ORF Transcript_71811/g.126817 Transcript_71811/m.126817 type:complete len:391 (-) Transcript_71811:32-1204(-)
MNGEGQRQENKGTTIHRLGQALIPDRTFKDPKTLFVARWTYFWLLVCLTLYFGYKLKTHFIDGDVGVGVENKWYWRMEVPSVAVCPAFQQLSFGPTAEFKIVKFGGEHYDDMANGELQSAHVTTNTTIPQKSASDTRVKSKLTGCYKLSFIDLAEDKKPKVVDDSDSLTRFVVMANLPVVGTDEPFIKFGFYDSMDAGQEPLLPAFYLGTTGQFFQGTISRRMILWKGMWPWQSHKRHEYTYEYSRLPSSEDICKKNGMAKGCTMISYEYKSFFISESVSITNILSISSVLYFLGFTANLVNLLNLFNVAFPNLRDERRRPSPLLVLFSCGFLRKEENPDYQDQHTAKEDQDEETDSDEEAGSLKEPLLKKEAASASSAPAQGSKSLERA